MRINVTNYFKFLICCNLLYGLKTRKQETRRATRKQDTRKATFCLSKISFYRLAYRMMNFLCAAVVAFNVFSSLFSFLAMVFSLLDMVHGLSKILRYLLIFQVWNQNGLHVIYAGSLIWSSYFTSIFNSMAPFV